MNTINSLDKKTNKNDNKISSAENELINIDINVCEYIENNEKKMRKKY